MTRKTINVVPVEWTNSVEHRRQLAQAVNDLISFTTKNRGVLRVTSATTLDDYHGTVYCDTDGGAITITLPAGTDWQKYRIINVGTSGNNVTVTPNGSELLIGLNSSFGLVDKGVLSIEYELTEGWW